MREGATMGCLPNRKQEVPEWIKRNSQKVSNVADLESLLVRSSEQYYLLHDAFSPVQGLSVLC